MKQLIIQLEQYCYYFFLITLFIGLNPWLIQQDVVYKNIHWYFAIFYSTLFTLGLPTMICLLKFWGRFERFKKA